MLILSVDDNGWQFSHQSVFPFILWSPPSTTTCLIWWRRNCFIVVENIFILTKAGGTKENLSVILQLLSSMTWRILEDGTVLLKESYFILSQISGLAAPLWVTVFSTRKIFTTRSTTSLSITSKVSTWQCQLNGRREENRTPQSQREASGQSSWSWEGRPQWRLGPCRRGKREEKEGNNFPREPPEEGTLPRRQESGWPSRWSGGENHFPFLGRVRLVLLWPTCHRAFARFLPKAPIRKHLDIKSLLGSS